MYKSAPVMLLDEPTAALDPIAESMLYENYNQISSQKTTIFVSHRLASTSFCDRILLIENGRICEEGNHNDNEIEENAPDGVKVDRATAESEDLTGRDSAVVVHIERKKNDARQSKKNGNSL